MLEIRFKSFEANLSSSGIAFLTSEAVPLYFVNAQLPVPTNVTTRVDPDRLKLGSNVYIHANVTPSPAPATDTICFSTELVVRAFRDGNISYYMNINNIYPGMSLGDLRNSDRLQLKDRGLALTSLEVPGEDLRERPVTRQISEKIHALQMKIINDPNQAKDPAILSQFPEMYFKSKILAPLREHSVGATRQKKESSKPIQAPKTAPKIIIVGGSSGGQVNFATKGVVLRAVSGDYYRFLYENFQFKMFASYKNETVSSWELGSPHWPDLVIMLTDFMSHSQKDVVKKRFSNVPQIDNVNGTPLSSIVGAVQQARLRLADGLIGPDWLVTAWDAWQQKKAASKLRRWNPAIKSRHASGFSRIKRRTS